MGALRVKAVPRTVYVPLLTNAPGVLVPPVGVTV
jgi:hypothetical protein